MQKEIETLRLAKSLAKYFHTGQKYGNHDYYSHHIKGVVYYIQSHTLITRLNGHDRFKDFNIRAVIHKLTIIAYLHDILEDTTCKLSTLQNIFEDDIVKAVILLTRTNDVSHEDYIKNIKTCPLASIVKIHDAYFNRLTNLDHNKPDRAVYYQSIIDQLLN